MEAFFVGCHQRVFRVFPDLASRLTGSVFFWFSLVAVPDDRLGNFEQLLKGEMLYFGRQVGACEIPDSTVRGRPVQGHVFGGVVA